MDKKKRGRPFKNEDKESSDSGRMRMTVDFPDSTSEHLKWLKKALQSSSYADVLRKAVTFLKVAVIASMSGGKVVITQADGTVSDWTEMLRP